MYFDTIIDNACIVTVEPQCRPFIGWVGISNGRIVAVEKGSSPEETQAREVIHADGRVLMPGLINSHCHGDMTLFRGIGDGLTLKEQCGKFRGNLWAGIGISDDDLTLSRQLTYLEAMASGTTFIMENMYWGMGLRSIDAMLSVGMRGALAQEYRAQRDLDPNASVISNEYYDQFASECRRNGLVPILSSIAEDQFQENYLKNVYRMAERNGTYVTQHFQETDWRMKHIREEFGCTPTEYMQSLGLFEMAPLIASHGVHVKKSDRDILKKYGVSIANTPVCEMKISDGIAPICEYLDEGINVSLGTDGAMWQNANDIFAEMKCVSLLQSVAKGCRSISARQALEMATINGARAFGLENEIGTISKGKSADLILVDIDALHMQPVRIDQAENVISSLVYVCTGRDVTDTFIRGKAVMRNREIRNVDVKAIISEARRESDRILFENNIE